MKRERMEQELTSEEALEEMGIQTAHANQCPECGNLDTGHTMDPPPHCGHPYERYGPVVVVPLAVFDRPLPEANIVDEEYAARWEYDGGEDASAGFGEADGLREHVRGLEEALRAAAEFIRSRPTLMGSRLLLDHLDDVLDIRPRGGQDG